MGAQLRPTQVLRTRPGPGKGAYMAPKKGHAPAEPDEQALRLVIEHFTRLSAAAFGKLLALTAFSRLPAGAGFVTAGRPDDFEYFILEGLVRIYAKTPDLRDVTLSFYPEGGILAPSLARNLKGVSSVSCETLEPTFLAAIPARKFNALMREDEEIRIFGNRVLEEELIVKTRKELSLATLPALERLLELRRILPGLENRAAQGHVASYLGITPISLSRLRGTIARSR